MKPILRRVAAVAAALAMSVPAASANAQAAGTASWPQLLQKAPRLGSASINSFEGSLEVPPPGTALFADLPLTGAGVDPDLLTGQAVYRIVLGDPFGANATFSGSRGRAVYDSQSSLPTECDPNDTYCATDNGYIVAGPPTNEYFAGLTVGDQPAIVRHITCCNGEYWSLSWYAPASDTSYGVDLALDIAGRLGASGIEPSNVEAAQALTEIASNLSPVQLSHAVESGGAASGDVPIKTAAMAFARFTGTWWHHGLTLQVLPDGRGSLSWRVYRWCGPGVPEPCDSMSGNTIAEGGRAAISFQTVNTSSGTAYGRVTSSSDPSTVPFGTLEMMLKPYGMAELRSGDQVVTTVCGPQFTQLAPPDVQSSLPCGA